MAPDARARCRVPGRVSREQRAVAGRVLQEFRCAFALVQSRMGRRRTPSGRRRGTASPLRPVAQNAVGVTYDEAHEVVAP